ncbi:Uncharacterized protein TCAP_01345 [Tolypocladium capitatum]|uniref:C2H2-type domain-containing protein n=1 Tax=Tolypocladium capitatum TaxID=45235 RepID=A0A2K3QMI1_9HYPO|nr:Uncharacterized protein TCAP_01345 [Tolypocladium capitatum]
MESFRRSSLEETGLAASALRRWTWSPTGHRLGLRRSATGSTAAVSVAVSVASLESDKGATTCVTRETSSDECALHRFIVWAAVKRNACAGMTPEERRECPLLRCRKRFPNHELMLQHLYSCEHLASGEYWCYDCGKAEQLGDIKCRRCLAHPSKRKKMMSVAKSFFGSLGHKSRSGSLPDLHLDMDDELACYEPVPEPPEVELQANEIHEIDSCELPLPTIGEEPEPFPAYISNPSSLPAGARPRASPAELGPGHSGIDESLINWEPSPTPPPPPAASEGPPRSDAPNPAERPVLQLNTQGLGYHRARSRRRSKVLAPSSSVRSTASTASTNSTNSTSSTAASCNISPMSSWSGAWSRAPGFDSTLTSPADDLADLADLADLFPRNDSTYRRRETEDHGMDLTGIAADAYLPELPAEVPMCLLPSTDTLQGDVDSNRSSTLTLGASIPTEQPMDAPMDSGLALTGGLTGPQEPTQLAADIARNQLVSAHSLIQTARNMLDVHVANSMTSLRRDGKNHLVDQFLNMSPNSVADAGLETMMDMLQGHAAKSAVELLCFVHVIYSLSVVVHEQDAPRRCTDLFIQAVSYGSWLSHRDRQAYIQVVGFLWKPSEMADGDLVELLQTSLSRPGRNLVGRKGKECTDTLEVCRFDALAFVAQYFLDGKDLGGEPDRAMTDLRVRVAELEDSALRDTQRPEIQASDLCMEHLQDVNLEAHEGSPFSVAASNTIDSLSLRYGSAPGFEPAMSYIRGRVKSSYVATPRRLELELMQAGKMRLSSDVWFDEYIAFVRRHLDALYELCGSGTTGDNPRLRYYRHGVRLMRRTMIRRPEPDQPTTAESSVDVPLDPLGLNGRMTPNLDDFFGSMPDFDFDVPTDGAAPVADTSIPDVGSNAPRRDAPAWLPTPEGTTCMGASSGGTGTPVSPAPSSSSPSSPNKVDSNSCCEICGYRPKGDPRWFGGSMAKHKKLQHGAGPPMIYKCPFPGCSSQYKSRPDNLRQHQMDRGHFVDGEDDAGQRPSKRKKTA